LGFISAGDCVENNAFYYRRLPEKCLKLANKVTDPEERGAAKAGSAVS
jgi:hypothetical protein